MVRKSTLSTLVILVILLCLSMQYAAAHRDTLKIEVTFIEGQDRNVDDARVYLQEYPQYSVPGGRESGSIDLIDAFYNDDPYTGIWKDEIVVPSDLIDAGEEFHICIEDTKKNITLACYELENGPESQPERLKIDFNNFPFLLFLI